MKPLRSFATVIAAAVVLSTAVVTGSITGATAQQPSTTQSDQKCAKQEVLLLMDQSQSLKDTDPGGLRVEGAQALVRSLAQTARASGQRVELAVGGFGEGAERLSDGKYALPTDEDAAVGRLAIFRDENKDQNTDYVLALQFATSYFTAITDVPPTCKRLVWFTDGAYSIDKKDAPGLAEYSDSRDKQTLQSQLASQVCGPLPPGSRLGQPLSAAVNAAGFSVQMIDLRVEGQEQPQDKRERAETQPVIDRLFGQNIFDPCRLVRGTRVTASEPKQLDEVFFAEGQRALGLHEIKCNLLSGGYPASMVTGLAVRANDSTNIRLMRDGEVLNEDKGAATYIGRARPGTITVEPQGSVLKVCFARLEAAPRVQGNSSVFGKATTSNLNFAVYGVGDDAVGAGVAKEFASITASVDGVQAEVSFDEGSKSWTVAIPGPLSQSPKVVVTATANGWSGPSLGTVEPSVKVASEPPPPQVAWAGTTTLQGKKPIKDKLVVTPAALNTGGQICVTLGEPKTEPTSITFSTEVGTPKCAPDSKPFEIEATLVSSESMNLSGRVDVPFSATYRPASGSEIPIGSEKVIFAPIKLTKPLDAGSVGLYTILFLLGSVVLTLGALLVGTNLQRRLPDSSRFRSVTVPVNFVDGVLSRSSDAIKMNDFEMVKGDRSGYQLPDGVKVSRSFTLNPFADPVAIAKVRSGLLAVRPAVTKGLQSSHQVPARFDHLTALAFDATTGVGTMTAIVPTGTKPEVAESSMAALLDSATRDAQKIEPQSKTERTATRASASGVGGISSPGGSEESAPTAGAASSRITPKGPPPRQSNSSNASSVSAPPPGGAVKPGTPGSGRSAPPRGTRP